jgi:hypothetical protein
MFLCVCTDASTQGPMRCTAGTQVTRTAALACGQMRATHTKKRRVSCTQASRQVVSIVRAHCSGVRTTAQGQRFTTLAATYCQHITSAATSGHQHCIDNALAQQLQSKYGTTLGKLISTDRILTLPTLQLQFSSAAGRVVLLHCQDTSLGAWHLRRVVYELV